MWAVVYLGARRGRQGLKSETSEMPWVFLIAAGLCEVVWAVALKYSQGFTRPIASAIAIVVMLLSFVLLAQAMRSMPLGTSYAIWTGIGAVGTAVVGMVWFGESRDVVRVACIGIIILGIVGLKLFARNGG